MILSFVGIESRIPVRSVDRIWGLGGGWEMKVQDSGSRRGGQEGIIRSRRGQDTIRRCEAGYGGASKAGQN